MGVRNQQKQKVIERADGSKTLLTGIFSRVIPAPQESDPLPSDADIAHIEKLLAAQKKHPLDPKAAIEEYRKSLSADELAEVDAAASAHKAAMQESEKLRIEKPRQAFARARTQCKKVLNEYGIDFDQLPDFKWADGTLSLDPDPRELTIPEIARDAVTALMSMHALIEELSTLRAFVAGMAYQRMLVRPFERHVFDAKQKVEAMNEARKQKGLVVDDETRMKALGQVDELRAAGFKVDAAVAKVAKDLDISKTAIYNWRGAAGRAR